MQGCCYDTSSSIPLSWCYYADTSYQDLYFFGHGHGSFTRSEEAGHGWQFNDDKSQITWNQYIPDGALEFNWGNKWCVTVLNVHTFLWSSQAVKLIMSCLDFHAIAWLCICACCIVTTYRNTFLYYCRLQISTEGIYHGKNHSVHLTSKEEWPACFCASSVHLCEALCMLKCIVVITDLHTLYSS